MQVNQNVNAANFLLVSSQANNVKGTTEISSDSVDFASVLKNTNENQKQFQNNVSVSKNQDVKTTVKQSEPKDDVAYSNQNKDANVQKTNQDTDVEQTKESTRKTTNEQKTENTSSKTTDVEKVEEVVEDIPDVEELSDEELAVLLETVGNLLNKVMEQFGLNMEELSTKLEEFGMDVNDLLTTDGLKEFFLQMSGADVSDLVVDETLNAQLQSFMGEVSEELSILQDFSVDVESVISNFDVETLVSKITEEVEVVTDEAFIANEKDVVVSEEGDSNDVVADTSEPEVTVHISKKQNKTDYSNSQEQTDSNAQYTATQETAVAESTDIKQQTSFENPILNAIQNAVNNVEGTVLSEQPIQQTDVVRQIVEQVRIHMNQQTTSMELQLYPEHLGRIQINVVAKEGVMTASIVAETEAAKQAIEAGLLNLKEAMEQQDLKVDAIEVMVSTTGFEHSDEHQDSFNQDNASKSRRSINLSELGEEIPEEDEVEIEKMKATGSSVSYRA